MVAVSPRPAAELEAAGVEATHIFNPIGSEIDGSRRRPQREAEPLQILFVGAYGRRKGVDDLLDALVQVRLQGHDVRAAHRRPPGASG